MAGRFKKASAPPLFLEHENFPQKSGSMVAPEITVEVQPWSPIFEKCSHLREKRRDSDFFPGLYGVLYGQNLPYKFKNSYGDFRNRNFEKSHRTTGLWSDLRPDS